MKRKLLLSNALMGLMILFAIVSQSIHAIEHLAAQFSEKKCHHVYQHHHTELHHGHDGLEKCFVCEFAFSNYTKPTFKVFSFEKIEINSKTPILDLKEAQQTFKGALFSLRGPPFV